MMWRVFKHLKQRGLSDRDLERQLGLSTHNPKHMTADDVSKLAAFAYHSHQIFSRRTSRAACNYEVPQ